MESIVFLDRGTVPVPLRAPGFLHRWKDYDATSPSETAARLKHATMVISNKVPLREHELDSGPALKLIVVAASGFDNVDLASCRRRGITVTNVPGYAQHTVPEHVFMLALALRRNLISYADAVRAGRWNSAPHFALLDFPVLDLRGGILGLIGYGAIAKRVQKIAEAFEMSVLIAERKGAAVIRPGRTAFEEVLRRADILSLHAPLSPETRGFIGAPELSATKKGAVLINTSRGSLVDEQALAAVLKSRHLGGAGIDVLSEEPPRRGNTLLEAGIPNLIVTPHMAWGSRQTLEVLAEEVVKNMEAFVAGKPRNVVS